MRISHTPQLRVFLFAAKRMGRWRSGADPQRNDFAYGPRDRFGLALPPGAHARRSSRC